MPKRLINRCGPDSIREFRLAARQRFDDALAMAIAGQRTGAIYLWGYTVEMLLKAAYFSFIGIDEIEPITWSTHLQPAIMRGKSMGIAWPKQGSGHNIRAWGELLIAAREFSTLSAYNSSFGREVQRHSQRYEHLWRETLRYHRNYAYLYEVRQIRETTEWFLIHSNRL